MIAVEVAEPAWTRALPAVRRQVRTAAAAAAKGVRRDIAVLLTSDEAVRALNERFRGKDTATNVLAFPDADPARLGDIALAYGVCAGEAAVQGKTLADHLRHLVVHGVLHLIGYDHIGEEDAARMEALERELLAAMNIPDPYGERSDVQL